MLARIVPLVILAAALAGLLYYSQLREEPLKVSGFIECDEVRLGSRVGGRVQKVTAEEGKLVEPGMVLVELEPFDLLERLAQATAEEAARAAEYDRLQKGFREEEIAQAKAQFDEASAVVDRLVAGPRKQEIAAAQAQLRLSKSRQELASLQYNRVKTLFDRNSAAREEFDEAATALRVAEENVQVADEALNQLLEGTRPEEIAQARAAMEMARQAWLLRKNGYRPEEVEQAKQSLTAARANVAAIREQVKELTIVAPVRGVVEAVELQPGDLVAAGAPVMTVSDTSNLWVRAYLPENLLAIKEGDVLDVTVDSFPGERFKAHVSFVARQAEFTPGNVQTPEERSKQVFRVKVTLDEGLDRLRAGMVADVWLGLSAPESRP